ncbi:MAG: hypothetical protein RL684_867 [Pseudomonadota bacterium]|jgi:P-type conjugative transfer protein TrbJ
MNATSVVQAKLRNAALAALLVLLGGFSALVPAPARAQAVVCVNCAEIVTQWLGYAEQLLQYAKQIEQYELQIDQYQNMVKNTKSLRYTYFDDALSTVRGIETIMNRASGIRYMMSNLDYQFRSYYPDVYRQMTSLRGLRPDQILLQDVARAQESYDAALTALQAARSQSQDLYEDQYRMDAVGSDLVGANGRLDALQAAGEYAQLSAQQLMKMRQLAMVQVQLQSTVIANQQRRDDSQRAAFENWIQTKPHPTQWGVTGHTSDDTP